MLDKLRKELTPDPNQYGGTKRCGVEHLLVDIWDAALTALDTGEDAVVLLGVDFKKAFNRMEYGACLAQLERLGASPGSLSMVRSFLDNRVMTIRLGSAKSEFKSILRGSPKGSVLGCALYCATTQNLDDPRGPPDDPGRVRAEAPPSPAPRIPASDFDDPGLAPIPTIPGGRIRFFSQNSESDSSEDSVWFWDSDGAASSPAATLHGAAATPEGERSLGSFKYIDDTTLVQAVPMVSAIRHLTTGTTIETLPLTGLERRFDDLLHYAEDIGMEINCAKTQLLCLSPNNGCQTVAVLNMRDGVVDTIDSMKLVGFVFARGLPDVQVPHPCLAPASPKGSWNKGRQTIFTLLCIHQGHS